jgi:hypothetical protein
MLTLPHTADLSKTSVKHTQDWNLILHILLTRPDSPGDIKYKYLLAEFQAHITPGCAC